MSKTLAEVVHRRNSKVTRATISEEIPSELYPTLRKEYLVLEAYCAKEGLELTRVELTQERAKPELIYFFTDKLGGYLSEALKRTLKDSSRKR